MIITHKLKRNFLRDRILEVTEVMQNDSNSHKLEISLFVGDDAWQVPDGVTAAVAFRKSDGTKGLYEKLPDDTPATSIDGSTVTAILAPQVLTAAGPAQVAVVLFDANRNRLATFPVKLNVIPDPSSGGQVSNDYFNPSLEELHANVVALTDQLQKAIDDLNAARESGELDGPPGPPGDANVTAENIESALGYVPAPKSYILEGTIDANNNVTLTNFNWEKLIAAIENNVYVAARLEQLNQSGVADRKLEFSLAVHDLYNERVDFINITSGYYSPGIDVQYITVEIDETVFYYNACIQY